MSRPNALRASFSSDSAIGRLDIEVRTPWATSEGTAVSSDLDFLIPLVFDGKGERILREGLRPTEVDFAVTSVKVNDLETLEKGAT